MPQDLLTVKLKTGITDSISIYKDQSAKINLADYVDFKRITGESLTYPYLGDPINSTSFLAGKTASKIASGFNHNIVLNTDGSLAAYGSAMALGLSSGNNVSNVPAEVITSDQLVLENITKIECQGNSYALSSDGDFFVWGYFNSIGTNYSTPFKLRTGVIDFCVSDTDLITLRDASGLLRMQVGTGGITFGGYGSLASALSGKTISKIQAYQDFVYVLCSDNTIFVYSPTSGSFTSVALNGALAGKTVSNIVGNYDRIFAICTDGNVAGIGANTYGKLGNGNTIGQTTWAAVNKTGALTGKTITNVSVGYNHTLFLCSDGTIAAVGGNYYGQLGNDSTIGSTVPVEVYDGGYLLGKTPTAIEAGYDHSSVITSDGNIFSWGYNLSGNLGNGTNTNSTIPVPVLKESFTKYNNHIRFTSVSMPNGLSFDGNVIETANIIGAPTVAGSQNALIKVDLSNLTVYNETPGSGDLYEIEATTYLSVPFLVKEVPTLLDPVFSDENEPTTPTEPPVFLQNDGVDLFFDLQSRALTLTPPKEEATIASDTKVINSLEAEKLLVKTGETLWLNVRFVKGTTPLDPMATGLRFGVAGKLGGPLLMEGNTFTKVGSGSSAYYRMRVTPIENEFSAIIDDYYDDDAVEQISAANENQPSSSGEVEGLCEVALTTGTGETIAEIKSDTLGVLLKRSIF
jgi:alpha-tubulin suppressor-like RCC1 family protein